MPAPAQAAPTAPLPDAGLRLRLRLIPQPPTVEPGGALTDLPTGTTVTIKLGAGSATYTYNGGGLRMTKTVNGTTTTFTWDQTTSTPTRWNSSTNST